MSRKSDPATGTRVGHPLCGARKRSGELCQSFAGLGTPHKGIGRCKFHGGNTPTHQRHAIKVEARQRMAAYGAPIESHPIEALLWVMHATAGHASWLNGEVARQPDLKAHEALVLVELYGQERDRLARVAKACLDAGVDDRQVKLAERNADVLATVLRAVHDALTLTAEQDEVFKETVQRSLQALAAGTPEAIAAEARDSDGLTRAERSRQGAVFGRRWKQAEKLGLTGVRGTDWDGRNERLRGLGFYDYDTDRWEQHLGQPDAARQAAYAEMEGIG